MAFSLISFAWHYLGFSLVASSLGFVSAYLINEQIEDNTYGDIYLMSMHNDVTEVKEEMFYDKADKEKRRNKRYFCKYQNIEDSNCSIEQIDISSTLESKKWINIDGLKKTKKLNRTEIKKAGYLFRINVSKSIIRKIDWQNIDNLLIVNKYNKNKLFAKLKPLFAVHNKQYYGTTKTFLGISKIDKPEVQVILKKTSCSFNKNQSRVLNSNCKVHKISLDNDEKLYSARVFDTSWTLAQNIKNNQQYLININDRNKQMPIKGASTRNIYLKTDKDVVEFKDMLPVVLIHHNTFAKKLLIIN